MTDEAIEREIIAKGLTAPRVTPASIVARIKSAHYFTAMQGAGANGGGYASLPLELGLLTLCVLVLENGFTVVGTSACASPENFDPGVGNQVAYAKAPEQVWPLEGYRLRQQLHEARQEPLRGAGLEGA